ncbi:MAG TPA: response regulator, partial [bacterium]|nr:response regulator [bacterium]
FALYLPVHPPVGQEEGMASNEGSLGDVFFSPTESVGAVGDGSAATIPDIGELKGRCMLVVDDDVRNIFAMTSLLEDYGIKVLPAESGPEALAILEREDAVDGILMDIMMPDMDGYDTIRAIRAQQKFKAIPIIAVTAKAMKEDRQKCIEAGASDYITKPVNSQRMMAMLVHWLKVRV